MRSLVVLCSIVALARAGHLGSSQGFISGGGYNDFGSSSVISGSAIGAAPIVHGGSVVGSDGAGLLDARSAQVIGPGPSAPRVHEIHAHQGPRFIRVEEYRGGRQLIRVHDGGQAAPEVIRVQGPSQQQDIVRLFTRGGQAQIQHVVRQAHGAQVFDVHRQPAPGPRYIHIVRGPAPAARVEVAHEPSAGSQIVLQPSASGETVVIGPSNPSHGGGFGAFGGGYGGAIAVDGGSSSYGGAVEYSGGYGGCGGGYGCGGGSYSGGSYGGDGGVHTVHTQVVPYEGGYSSGGHVKIIKKYH